MRGAFQPGNYIDGTLYAPTFVHGRGARFRLRARLMAAAGFRVYFK